VRLDYHEFFLVWCSVALATGARIYGRILNRGRDTECLTHYPLYFILHFLVFRQFGIKYKTLQIYVLSSVQTSIIKFSRLIGRRGFVLRFVRCIDE
jgi:hypothetical protein